MRWRIITAGTALLMTTTAVANTPPPIPMFSYYGPVRHCGDGFALEARRGEGLIVVGEFEAALRLGRHNLGVSRITGGYAVVTDPAIIRRTGTLAVEGVGTFVRYRVSAGQPGDARVTYLFDPGGGIDRAHQIEIGSDLFDGSDVDRTLLSRVALGDRATALCAAVPDTLRPTSERVRPDAFLMRETRYPGPLTVCWAHVALDVAAGETVVLPWDPEQHRFALIAPGLEVGIAGDFRSGSDLDGALPGGVVGSLLPFFTHFTIGAGSRGGWTGDQFMRAGVPVTNRARLLANRDIKAIGPEPGPGLSFGFSRPLPDADRDAIIGRVRTQTAPDHCFDPDHA